ncbi:tetratricopeptide repeat protein [Treponema sp.]|uniref:tetratricopeptide repeat protein n=1 Tax=Treponema sp. TaxID=166 RepID=UPI003890EBF8
MKSFILFPFLCFMIISCSVKEDVKDSYSEAIQRFSCQEFDKAETSCDRFLRANRNYYPALLLKAKILFYTGRQNSSVKLLKKIERKYPFFIDGKLFLIKALIDTDRLSEAEIHLNEFMKDNSSDFRIYELHSRLAKKNKDLELRFSWQKMAEQCLEEGISTFLDLAAIYKEFGLEDISDRYLTKAQFLTEDRNLQLQIDEIKNINERKQ